MARRESPRQQLLMAGPAMLGRLLDEQDQLQQQVWALGRDLVLGGTSYAALGRMLGVSPQAARQRFSRHVEAWRSEHGDAMPWEVEQGWAVDDSAVNAHYDAMVLLDEAGL